MPDTPKFKLPYGLCVNDPVTATALDVIQLYGTLEETRVALETNKDWPQSALGIYLFTWGQPPKHIEGAVIVPYGNA